MRGASAPVIGGAHRRLDNPGDILPGVAARIRGQPDPHRYYAFIGASAFVFSSEQECRRLFGSSPQEADFVERHADFVVALLFGA